MRTKLIVFILSAAIFASSHAALARGKDGKRYEAPRVQHSQQRDRGKKQHYARGHREMHGNRHARRMDRHPRHGRDWSRHQPRHFKGRSHHQHGRYKHRRHHYPTWQRTPARAYHHPESSLSIILHGHF